MYRKWLFYSLFIVLMVASIIVGCAHPGSSTIETNSDSYSNDTMSAPHSGGSGSSNPSPSYTPAQSAPRSSPQGSGIR